MKTSIIETAEIQTTTLRTSACEPTLWRDIAAAAACVVFAVLISVLPHIVWWMHSGNPVWIADNDELLYLTYAGQAYFNHPGHLSDSVFAGDRPTHYQWLQLIPGVLVARLVSGGPPAIGIVWRMWAGLSIAIAWYLLFRFYSRKPGTAFLLTMILLADVGVLAAHPIWRQLIVAYQIAMGHTTRLLGQYPQIHTEWRIITPGLSLCYLLLHLWLIARAREIPSSKRIVLAGLSLGLLFYAYFYDWTAACFALAICCLLDAKNRKIYFVTALIGVFTGAPALLSTLSLKRSATPDWNLRTDLGFPISRLSELLIPKIAIVLLLVLFIWIWRQRRELVYVWTMALSGLLLANHQIITGMQLENEHWAYVWGPCLSFLLILGTGDILLRSPRKRAVTVIATIFVFAHCVVGLGLRAIEATRSRESVENTTAYHRYSEQQSKMNPALVANNVVAGDKDFVYMSAAFGNLRPLDHYAAVMSPWVDNAELDSRLALNAFLRGLDRSAFEVEQKKLLEITYWGPEARSPAKKAERLAHRLKEYDEISLNPSMAIARFNVRYVALDESSVPPSYLQQEKWHEISQGPYWRIWQRS